MTRASSFSLESLKIRETIRKKFDLIYMSTDCIAGFTQS